MKQRICDRCGKRIENENNRFRIMVRKPGNKSIRGKDLCPKCYEAYIEFMDNEGGEQNGD